MTLQKIRPVIAGIPLVALTLILLTNLVVLAGVAYNRSGAPGSLLTLSQRELGSPWDYDYSARENSGVSLHIGWRTLDNNNNDTYAYLRYGSHQPHWLDQEKMLALGFPLPPVGNADAIGRYQQRMSEKEVFLVLELAGPAWRESIEDAHRAVARAKTLQNAAPDDMRQQSEVKDAEEYLRRTQTELSRLFVIDAGLDAGALRARYAGRTGYAIVRGRISPSLRTEENNEWVFGGYINGLSVDRVHAPAGSLPVVAKPGAGIAKDARYEAIMGWGKRFEPWLVASSVIPATPTAAPESGGHPAW